MAVAGIVGLLFVGKWILQDKAFHVHKFSCQHLLTIKYFCRRNYLCCDGFSLTCSMDRRIFLTYDLMETGPFCRGLLGAAVVVCTMQCEGCWKWVWVGFSKWPRGFKPTPATSASSLLPYGTVPYQCNCLALCGLLQSWDSRNSRESVLTGEKLDLKL